MASGSVERALLSTIVYMMTSIKLMMILHIHLGMQEAWSRKLICTEMDHFAFS